MKMHVKEDIYPIRETFYMGQEISLTTVTISFSTLLAKISAVISTNKGW